MQDAAAFIFGGPLALAKLRGLRAHRRRQARARQAGFMPQALAMRGGFTPGFSPGGPGASQMPVVNVYCPPYGRRRRGDPVAQQRMLPPGAMPRTAWTAGRVLAPPQAAAVVAPPPPATVPAPAAASAAATVKPAVSGLGVVPGGIFGPSSD
jgi:hypothetical protein